MRWNLFWGVFSLVVIAGVVSQFSPKPLSRLPQLPPLEELVSTVLPTKFTRRFLPPERVSEPTGVSAEPSRRTGTFEQAVATDELRVWAIRNGHKYGWVQLPKGTTVSILRRDGDHAVIRWDESVVRVPQTALRMGALRWDGKPAWFQ
jgi:hypothetical protein